MKHCDYHLSKILKEGSLNAQKVEKRVLEIQESFLGLRGRREAQLGTAKPTWNISMPPSKTVREEQVGPRRTVKPK